MSLPKQLCAFGGCSKEGNIDTMLLGEMQEERLHYTY
jgi:hypothetical protein